MGNDTRLLVAIRAVICAGIRVGFTIIEPIAKGRADDLWDGFQLRGTDARLLDRALVRRLGVKTAEKAGNLLR